MIARALASWEARLTAAPADPRLHACTACRYLVESVDSHGACDECAAERDAADEREAAEADALEAAELGAWCDALREAAIAHQLAAEAELAADRPLPHRSAA